MSRFLAMLAVVLASLTSTPAYSWDQRPNFPVQACAVHSPWGFAQSQRQLIPLCKEGYLSAYDPQAKIPGYVAYTLMPQNAIGCWPRTNAFVQDATVANGPRPDDYAGTGYDKGHAAPDGDLSWSQQVEYESFLMTNMFPQLGGLNRGIWKLLETNIRGWAVQQNVPFTIYVGGIYGPGDKTIGQGVVVPNAFYKIVINQKTNQVAGWLFPHAGGQGNDLVRVRATVAQIQQLAGIKFAFPANAVEVQPGQEWPIDYGALTNAKRAKCGKNAE